MRNKYGQIWVSDALTALVIISISLAIFFLNYINMDIEKINTDIDEDIKKVSEYLMLPGVPNDWNKTNVLKIGLLNDDYSINKSKLKMMDNISVTDFENVKTILDIENEFFIYFTDKNDNIIEFENKKFFGAESVNTTNIGSINTKEIIKTKRYLIRENLGYKEIINMNIYMWN